ncbi:hypothetical protein HRbin08_00037 [bacterium HR08]|nr:hypothetical protein HRbin08_00037 [bacterium HR08]
MLVVGMQQEGPRKVALGLCGGGSRGAVEVGLYRALLELGVPIDEIVGVSIGAVNGAVMAAGMPVHQLVELWQTVTFADLFAFNRKSFQNDTFLRYWN